MAKEDSGMSITTLSLFNGTDYGYWKSWMEIFLNAYDPRVWSAIVNGYTQCDKPRSDWTPAKAVAHKFNFRTLNAIASGIALDEFQRIIHLKMLKETWKFLSITREGTSTVKMSKLQMYTIQLKTLRMEEDEEKSLNSMSSYQTW